MGSVSVFVMIVLGLMASTLLLCSCDDKKSYIVFMDAALKPKHFAEHEHWYSSLVTHRLGYPKDAIMYNYKHLVHGFAAKMRPSDAAYLRTLGGCLNVVEDFMSKLHTTRTPDFLGLSSPYEMIWPRTKYGKDVVIGVLDTGIWPESKSFKSTQNMPPPHGWKGECESGTRFNSSHCNGKIVGARFFLKGYEAMIGSVDNKTDYRSPRDANGHGTHTASTAGGNAVAGANLFGYATGNARGMATRARIAAYKVCWSAGCVNSDLLAGLESAVADGVHVISSSIGTKTASSPLPYYKDPFTIGAFRAMRRGILVACSAGNDGPTPALISNTAPWITTVGAATLDREFPAPVILGNNISLPGSSLYKPNDKQPKIAKSFLPLVPGSQCLLGTLSSKVKGKVVFCERGTSGRVEKGLEVKRAGGAGMILANQPINGEDLLADSHVLPAAVVGAKAGLSIKSYMNTTRNPKAIIQVKMRTVVGKTRAPSVADFSSRGPNPVVEEILKPDLVAPGVNILAAWTGRSAPTDLTQDKRRVTFNVVSGTSMSCPHVSGIAALVKEAHPRWSPAAIKSALMTSAHVLDNRMKSIGDSYSGKPANPHGLGSGHVNPAGAISPGLVYDVTEDDYVSFLCSLNYTAKQIYVFTEDKSVSTCKNGEGRSVLDLNYPSFSVVFDKKSTVKVTERTVTDVGEGASVYKVKVASPRGVKIDVQPKVLKFGGSGEKASYNVTFSSVAADVRAGDVRFGYVLWECVQGVNQGRWFVVRSPVSVTWKDA